MFAAVRELFGVLVDFFLTVFELTLTRGELSFPVRELGLALFDLGAVRLEFLLALGELRHGVIERGLHLEWVDDGSNRVERAHFGECLADRGVLFGGQRLPVLGLEYDRAIASRKLGKFLPHQVQDAFGLGSWEGEGVGQLSHEEACEEANDRQQRDPSRNELFAVVVGGEAESVEELCHESSGPSWGMRMGRMVQKQSWGIRF